MKNKFLSKVQERFEVAVKKVTHKTVPVVKKEIKANISENLEQIKMIGGIGLTIFGIVGAFSALYTPSEKTGVSFARQATDDARSVYILYNEVNNPVTNNYYQKGEL